MNPETIKLIEQYGAWLIGGNLEQAIVNTALKELYQTTFGKSQTVCDEFALYLSSFLSQTRLNCLNQFFIECESLNTNGFLRNSCLLKPFLKLEIASHHIPEACDFGIPRVLLQHYQLHIKEILWQECQTKQDYTEESQKSIYLANTLLRHMQFNLGIKTKTSAHDIYTKITTTTFEITLDQKPISIEALKKFWVKEMEDFLERIQIEIQSAIETVIKDTKDKTSGLSFFKNPMQTVRNWQQDYQAINEVKKFQLRLMTILGWILTINNAEISLKDLMQTYQTACAILQNIALQIEAMIDINNQLEAKMKATSAMLVKQLEQKFLVLQQTEILQNKPEEIVPVNSAIDSELMELLNCIQNIDIVELDTRLQEAEKQIADKKIKREGAVFDPMEVRKSLKIQAQKPRRRATTLTAADLESLQSMQPEAAPSHSAEPSRSTLN